MSQNQGFIQLIIILVLSIVILSLLGVSVSSFLNDQTLRENFSFVRDLTKRLWNDYGLNYAKSIWNLIRSKLDSDENTVFLSWGRGLTIKASSNVAKGILYDVV